MDHIILSVVGSSVMVKKSYQKLETVLSRRFSESTTTWLFLPPGNREPTVNRKQIPVASLNRLLSSYRPRPGDRLIVQPISITAGIEFHQIVTQTRAVRPDVGIGMPLLSSRDDHHHVADTLTDSLGQLGDETILLIGHGTSHPSWTTYVAFTHIFGSRLGRPVLFGSLQDGAERQTIVERLTNAGTRKLLVIPLMLSTGTHFQRDIAGAGAQSWLSQLQRQGIETTLHASGLAALPGVAAVFCDHIEKALQQTIIR